ncbi:hypothetical protein T484DRAFT_1758260, partial [Baffinella frigidus]
MLEHVFSYYYKSDAIRNMAAVLLEHGEDINEIRPENHNRRTLLHKVVLNERRTVMEEVTFLIENGALDLKDIKGFSAVDLAYLRIRPDVADHIEKQFELRRGRYLALAMATHDHLGDNSHAQDLTADVLRIILGLVLATIVLAQQPQDVIAHRYTDNTTMIYTPLHSRPDKNIYDLPVKKTDIEKIPHHNEDDKSPPNRTHHNIHSGKKHDQNQTHKHISVTPPSTPDDISDKNDPPTKPTDTVNNPTTNTPIDTLATMLPIDNTKELDNITPFDNTIKSVKNMEELVDNMEKLINNTIASVEQLEELVNIALIDDPLTTIPLVDNTKELENITPIDNTITSVEKMEEL